MFKHKNLIMIVAALIMFIYAGFLTIYPAFLTASFNKEKFGQAMYKATGLVTTVEDVEFRMKPNFNLIISINGWSSKYIDKQDCFDAGFIEINTGAFSPITKNFKIKSMLLNNVTFANQLLPEGINKLAYLPKSFEAKPFGTNKIKINTGNVYFRKLLIKQITSTTYKEIPKGNVTYPKQDVKQFFRKLNIRNVEIK